MNELIFSIICQSVTLKLTEIEFFVAVFTYSFVAKLQQDFTDRRQAVREAGKEVCSSAEGKESVQVGIARE